MCMCVINRNNVKLSKIIDQILVFNLCAKSLEQKRNISTPNAFTIYDINKLSIKDIETLILESIKKYNHDIDILFYDEFGILCHQLISGPLFYDKITDRNYRKYIKIYYLYIHTSTFKDFILSYKKHTETFLNNIENNFKGHICEVLGTQDSYVLETRRILSSFSIGDLINQTTFNNHFIKDNQTRTSADLPFENRICLTINKITTEIILYLENDPYTLKFKNCTNFSEDIHALLVIDIKYESIYNDDDFAKRIIIVFLKDNTEVENKQMLRMIFYKASVYIDPAEYLLLENRNQTISDIYKNTKITNARINYNLLLKKLRVNIIKVLLRFFCSKNIFHITTKHWVGNESIILQGRKKIYQRILKIENKAEMKKCMNEIVTKIENDLKMKTNLMVFDLPSNLTDPKELNSVFISTNTPFYRNLTLDDTILNHQDHFNCFGYQISKDYKYSTNNIYMFVISSAVFKYNSYDFEKRIDLFENKILKKITCYTEDQKLVVESFLKCFLDDECIQDIPINLLCYLHSTNDFRKENLETIFERILKQQLKAKFIQKDSTLTETSLRYICLKKLLLDLLLWSINEMIIDLFIASCNKESVIIFQNEFAYLEDDFDKIFSIADNYLKLEEPESDITHCSVEELKITEKAEVEEESSTFQEPE